MHEVRDPSRSRSDITGQSERRPFEDGFTEGTPCHQPGRAPKEKTDQQVAHDSNDDRASLRSGFYDLGRRVIVEEILVVDKIGVVDDIVVAERDPGGRALLRLDRSHTEDRTLSTRWVEVRFPGRGPRLSGSNHGSKRSVGTKPQKRSQRSRDTGIMAAPLLQDQGRLRKRAEGGAE